MSESKYAIIDYPIDVPLSRYASSITRMTERLVALPSISSVYQIGGVSAPGISDIDLVAVFENGAACHSNLRSSLDKTDKYLFAHDLYGASVSEFKNSQRFSLFHNYKLLWGHELLADDHIQIDDPEKTLLKRQIAYEYLIRMYVNLTFQRTYKTIKLRDFFLHSKAIMYDLEFLGVEHGVLYDLIRKCIDIRLRWFQEPVPSDEICTLFDDLYEAIHEFVGLRLTSCTLYLPYRKRYSIGAPSLLLKTETLGYRHEGFLLPHFLHRLGKNYFNLQNRLNRFVFEVPFDNEQVPDFLEDRFNTVDDARSYHRNKLPNFAVLMSSLAV